MKYIGIFFILVFLFAGLNVYADNETAISHTKANQNQVQGESEETNDLLITPNPYAKGKYETAKEKWAEAKTNWISKKDSTNKQAMVQKGTDFLLNSVDRTEAYFLKIQEKLKEQERLVLAEKIQEKLQTISQIREQVQAIETTDDMEKYALQIKQIWQEKAIVKNAIHLSVLYNAYNYNKKLEELIIKLDKRIEILENKGYNMQEIETNAIKTKIIEAKKEYNELEAEYKKMEEEQNYGNIDFLKNKLQAFHNKIQEIRQEIATLTERIRERIQGSVVE